TDQPKEAEEGGTVSKLGVATIRWAARVLSVFFVVVVLLMTVVPDPYREPRALRFNEIVELAFLPWGVLIGTLLAWRWERIGGFIAVGSLLAFYSSFLLLRGWFPSGPWFLLFSLPGILFLLLSFLDRNHK
ncbi:MAG: hypothetical protein AB1700_09020, partial [Bacillota bacterium]